MNSKFLQVELQVRTSKSLFKFLNSNPCVGGLVEMLNETCVPDSFGQSRSTSSSGSKRNLLEQLEKVTPKKKPRKQSRVVVETPDEDTD